MTILGESHLLPLSLLSHIFGKFSAIFFSFCVFSQLGHSFVWDPSPWDPDLLPSLYTVLLASLVNTAPPLPTERQRMVGMS